MSVGEKIKGAGVEYDRRVRSRLLTSGELDPAIVQDYLASLPDLADQAEIIPVDQPALGDSSHGRLDADADEDGFE